MPDDAGGWLERMRAREAPPWRRFYAWTTRYGASTPLPGTPPPGLEGFRDGRRRTAVLWSPIPIRVAFEEWSSADGTVTATRSGGLLFFTTHLRSGQAVVTWPNDRAGKELAGQDADRISVVAGRDPFASHLEAVARVADADPPVAFLTVAEREEAGSLYDVHNASDASAWLRVVSFAALVPLVLATVAALGYLAGRG